MYRVYLKVFNDLGLSEVIKESKTITPSPVAAEAAFRELLKREDLIGLKAHVVLSLDNRHLEYHRFDRCVGDADYVDPDGPIRLFHDS